MTEIKLYNGEVTLLFDPVKHKYFRVVDGQNVPVQGVTRTVKILDKSNQLISWAVKVMAERLLKTVPIETDDENYWVRSMPWGDFEELVLAAKKAHKEIKEDAGNVGQEAHDILEDLINQSIESGSKIQVFHGDSSLDSRILNCVIAAIDWMTKHNVRWLWTEKIVYSKKHDFCGTLDGLALVDSCSDRACCPVEYINKTCLIDWKSGNGIYPEMAYQTEAYRRAEQEETGTITEAKWIIRLGKDDGIFYRWYVGPEHFDADWKGFLGCLDLTRNVKLIEKRIREVKKSGTKSKDWLSELEG